MKTKKIAIIGAGFTGLAAAYKLSKKGLPVTVYEMGNKPGGLAVGFENEGWMWSLEEHYHHWFTNDKAVLDLCKELDYPYRVVRPKTSTYYEGKILQLDSAMSLLAFDGLSIRDRLRVGMVIAYFKLTNNWKALEKYTAKDFLVKTMGEPAWIILWEPLFVKKFSKYAQQVSAAWFWARIKKRTPTLAYPEGGFLSFAKRIEAELIKNSVEIKYKNKVEEIYRSKNKLQVKTSSTSEAYDHVVSTLPFGMHSRIVKGLPQDYIKRLNDFSGLGVINLVVCSKRPILSDGSYWLSVNDMDFPFLAVVQHTNFMDKVNYGNQHIAYIANYLPFGHKYFSYTKEALLKIFMPYLKKIDREFLEEDILDLHKFQSHFAQPVMDPNYSRKVLPFATPIENLHICNIQQVYPWDRGTNYAVELGFRIADEIIKKYE